MEYSKYIVWKKWHMKDFGLVNPGLAFYFDQIFKPMLKVKSSVLEIGFGNGELLGYLRAHGHEVVGVEVNGVLVEWAKKSGYNAHQGLIWDITGWHEKFDLVVAFDVVEHLGEKELHALFAWVRRYLKNEGKLILRFPEGASPLGLASQHGDFTHVTTLTKQKVEALCAEHEMVLLSYKDNLVSSNKLCSWGLFGKILLLMLQGYAFVLTNIMKLLFYPIATSISFATGSIAVIAINSMFPE